MDSEQIKLKRQMYELACHFKEGWLTDREKRIVRIIGTPNLENARQEYKLALIEAQTESLKKYRNYKKAKWAKAFEKFCKMYNKQLALGITKETEILLCQWALGNGVPGSAIMKQTHHSRMWINKYVKDEGKAMVTV